MAEWQGRQAWLPITTAAAKRSISQQEIITRVAKQNRALVKSLPDRHSYRKEEDCARCATTAKTKRREGS